MGEIIGIVQNYVLVCAFISWAIAQTIKCITDVVKNKKFDFNILVSSGGMPSSHSSTVCAVAAAAARSCGTRTVEFALAFVLAFIVMYDAAGVRRAAGEQAKLLNRITADISNGDTRYLDKNLKELIGHSPLQVVAGAVLGVIIPFLIPVF